MTQVAASVLNADFSKMKQWLSELEKAKIDRIQWDLMDNKYVPNNGLDIDLIKKARAETKIFFETHLMTFKPETYFEKLAEYGSEMAIIHIETTKEPLKTIQESEEYGLKPGIAVNLKTPVEKIIPYIDKVDVALVMTVNAGFGGQKFEESTLEKIKTLREKIDSEKLECLIEVDGGINAESGAKCVKAGTDILVAGTGLFKHPKGIIKAAEELRKA